MLTFFIGLLVGALLGTLVTTVLLLEKECDSYDE